MTFSIRYLAEYRYDSPVTDNLDAPRVRPATTSTQRTDDFHVRTEPESRLSRRTDYFGTEVIEFGIPKPHDHISIDVRARVVTAAPADPPDASWTAVGGSAYEQASGEFLLPTGDERPATLLADLHAQVRASSPLETLHRLCELIPDRSRYDQDATYVGSAVEDLLRGGGVCQDFVHLALVLLRRQGIAARYVSGDLWASREDGGGDSMEVNTHAGLEALMPGTGGGVSPPGWARIRRTAAWPVRPTRRSATAAATRTCRRSRASAAPPAPSSARRCR